MKVNREGALHGTGVRHGQHGKRNASRAGSLLWGWGAKGVAWARWHMG